MRPHPLPFALLAVPFLTVACYGEGVFFEGNFEVGSAERGVPDPVVEASACTPGLVEPGDLPLQRLTRDQYNHVVADLLGVTSRPADAFPAEEEVLGFDNIAAAHQPSQLLTDKFLDAAEAVSRAAALDTLLPCPLTLTVAAEQDSCVRDFLSTFGARAYRRPLTEDESTRLFALFTEGRTQVGFTGGIRWTIQAMLQSPHFLYRVEFGDEGPGGEVVTLPPLEMASRLSFLLWQSVPDQALLEAANEGRLSTAEGVEAEARRMLADERSRRAISHFHKKWLQLDSLAGTTKDPVVYPDFAQMKPLFAAETERFLEHVFFEADGSASRLFKSDVTFANETLAAFYGLTGVTGTDFVPVPQPERRAGFLTQGAFLAAHAKPNESSPVHRGKFVREQLLCTQLPPPPDDVPPVPEPDPSLTTRERFAEHTADPGCAGCHVLIDPIGFGFEGFDGEGQLRTEEAGKPIDDSGNLEGAGDEVDGDYFGADALSEKLAQSPVVMECLATQWFRYAYGRIEQSEDACSKERISRRFEESGYNLRELLVSLTQTDAFLYRRRPIASASTPGGSP